MPTSSRKLKPDWENFRICLNVLMEDSDTRRLLKLLINKKEILDKTWVKMKLAELSKEIESRN